MGENCQNCGLNHLFMDELKQRIEQLQQELKQAEKQRDALAEVLQDLIIGKIWETQAEKQLKLILKGGE